MREKAEFDRVQRQVSMAFDRARRHVAETAHPDGSCGPSCPVLPAGEDGPGVTFRGRNLKAWAHHPTRHGWIVGIQTYVPVGFTEGTAR